MITPLDTFPFIFQKKKKTINCSGHIRSSRKKLLFTTINKSKLQGQTLTSLGIFGLGALWAFYSVIKMLVSSVTSKKSPNVYKSCKKMISL